MNCLEFRRSVGAEPFRADAAFADHRAGCPGCARHQDELRAMDALLGKAMSIAVPEGTARGATRGAAPGDCPRQGTVPSGAVPSRVAPSRAAPRRRWLALAASLVAGVLVASTLWLSYPSPTLAHEVIGHAAHEPMAWSMNEPLADEAVAEVLRSAGVRLRAGAGEVTFAKRCFFDRHWVPHLVVQAETGPVTVFLLGHREVAAPARIDDEGYAALVLPAPRGSVAIVARSAKGLDAVARKIFESVEWRA